MKKLFMIVCLTAMALITMAYAGEETSLIKQSDYGAEVIALHQKLIELGIFNLRAESPWGPASIEALKIVQSSLGLEITGSVKTSDELETLLQLDIDEIKGQLFIPLQKGSKGERVKVLQSKLNELGFSVGSLDGDFGNKTQAGLMSLQKTIGMEENGIVRTKDELEYILSLSTDDIQIEH